MKEKIRTANVVISLSQDTPIEEISDFSKELRAALSGYEYVKDCYVEVKKK